MAKNKQFLDYKGTTIIADEIKTTQNSISEVSNELQRKAIPADMAQNDSTQFDYVKNRTHYIESRIDAIYSNVATFDSTTSSVSLMAKEPIGLEAGKTYKVLWNGETYAVIGDTYVGGIAIGDTHKQGQFPFLITDAIEDYAVIVEYLKEIEEGDSLNVNFTIAENVEIIHKLDNRYLPDGVAYTTDIEENIRPYAKDVDISSTTQNVNITAATNNINLNANGNINLRGTTLPITGTGAMTLESPNTTTVGANITMANDNIFMVGGGKVEINKPTMIVNNTEALTMNNGAMNITSNKGINIVSIHGDNSGVSIQAGNNPLQLISTNIKLGNGFGDTIITNPTTITKTATIAGAATMNGEATINGPLTVQSGYTTLHSGAMIEQGLTVYGKVQLFGNSYAHDIETRSLTMCEGGRNILIGRLDPESSPSSMGSYNYISGEENKISRASSSVMVMGNNNCISGTQSQAKCAHSFVLGNNNGYVSQDHQFIVGHNNDIDSSGTGTPNLTIFGNNNKVNNRSNTNIFIVGTNNAIGSGYTFNTSCAYNSVFGANHLVKETSHHSFIVGRDNISSGDAQLIGGYLNDNDENNLLEIGNGYKVVDKDDVENRIATYSYTLTTAQELEITTDVISNKVDIFKITEFIASPPSDSRLQYKVQDSQGLIVEMNLLTSSELPYTIDMSSHPNASSVLLCYFKDESSDTTANVTIETYSIETVDKEIGEVRQNAVSVSKQGVVKASDYITDMGYELVAVVASSSLSISDKTDTEYLFEPTIDSAAAYDTTLRVFITETGEDLFNAPIGAGTKITVPSSLTHIFIYSWSHELNQHLPINVYKKKKDISLKDSIKELKTITVDGVERTGVLKRAKVTVTPTVDSRTYRGKQVEQDESTQHLRFLHYKASVQVPLTDVGITDSSKVVVLSTQTYQHEYLYMGQVNVIPMKFRCFGVDPFVEPNEVMMFFEGSRTDVTTYFASSSTGPVSYSQIGDVDLVIEWLELEDLPTAAAVIEVSEEEIAAMVATLNEIDEIEEEN